MSDTRKSYEVLTPVVWDGEARKPGEIIKLNDLDVRAYSAAQIRPVPVEPAKAGAASDKNGVSGGAEAKPKKQPKAVKTAKPSGKKAKTAKK